MTALVGFAPVKVTKTKV